MSAGRRIFPSSPPPRSFISQPVVLSLRVTFDSLQPFRASSPKMTTTKDYSALPLQKYACIAGYHNAPLLAPCTRKANWERWARSVAIGQFQVILPIFGVSQGNAPSPLAFTSLVSFSCSSLQGNKYIN